MRQGIETSLRRELTNQKKGLEDSQRLINRTIFGCSAPLSDRNGRLANQRGSQTEDEECYLHPDYLVTMMPYTRAKEWQARLRHMDENHRCVDRALLPEQTSPDEP